MLSRRTLIGTTAVLAAGCGGLDIPFPVLGTPKITPLTWVSRIIPGISPQYLVASPEEELRRIERNLAEDSESSFGPTRGRYSLSLQYFERYAGPYSDPKAEEFYKPEHLASWLNEIGADLVTVWHDEARALGERGALLPLDRFSGDGSGLSGEYYSSVLDYYREKGALYALPVGADPLMLSFDADYFESMGVAPPDGSWDWDVLVENALKLTQREEDGTVTRWGLIAHDYSIWWALWQNEAEVADALTSQCRLQEPAAVKALEYIWDLMHTHGVSPAASGQDLGRLIYGEVDSPPAMIYFPVLYLAIGAKYRRAELPRGKVQSTQVNPYPGIAIAAQTANPEAAYTALRGLVKAMQPNVRVPSEREAVARLGQIQPNLQPEEVIAIQQSMEYGRGRPDDIAQRRAMFRLVEALARGDDVTSAVNQGCTVFYENQQA
jgi:hypothetical protein